MSSGGWLDVSVTEVYEIGWVDRWMHQWTLLLKGDCERLDHKRTLAVFHIKEFTSSSCEK